MFSVDLGAGVRVRPYEEVDAEAVQALIEADRERLTAWLPWAAGATLEGTREYVRASRRRSVAEGGFDAVILVDGVIVGSIGLLRVDRANRSAEIGYWLAAGAEGRGLMTRACAAVLDHAFGPMGLHRIVIQAGAGNARSRAVPERLGFTEEGVLRDNEWLGGRWIDHVVYGMLAAEWAARPSRQSDDRLGRAAR